MTPSQALVVRSWCASRLVLPIFVVALVLSGIPAVLPLKGLQLGHWTRIPPLSIPYVNVYAGLAAVLVTTATLSRSSEWERSARPRKLRAAQLVTWFVGCIGVSSTGPLIGVWRLSSDQYAHPWSIVTTQVLVDGLIATTVGLFGSIVGTTLMIAVLTGSVVAEVTTGTRIVVSDPFNPPALIAAALAVTAGCAVQWLTAGTPPLRRRNTPDD